MRCIQRSATTVGVARAAVAAAAPVSAKRNYIMFSEQNPVLQNNAKARKFQSNVWVDAEQDTWWTSPLSAVKQGERPTEVTGPARLELFNLSQIENPPKDLPTVTAPTSLRTGKAFSKLLAEDLNDRTAANPSLESLYWLGRGEIKSRNLTIKPSANRPSVLLINVPMKLLNADQFAEPSKISAVPVSGGSKKPYGSALSEHITPKLNGNRPLLFSPKQLETLGLTLKEGAAGMQLPDLNRSDRGVGSVGKSYAIYNADDVEGSEKLMEQLQRYPVDVPTYLISGNAVGEKFLQVIKGLPTKVGRAPGNYWISNVEIESRGLSLKEGTTAVELPNDRPTSSAVDADMQNRVFSVDELTDPSAGFAKAGLITA